MVDHGTRYIFAKRGIYYFSRRVPKDLKHHYRHERVTLSLRTRSLRSAKARAATLAAKLDEDWLTLRWRSSANPFSRFLAAHAAEESSKPSSAPLLSEAKKLYLEVKGKARPKTFAQSADRSVGYMIALLGDRPIDTYSRLEVNRLRDVLTERGLKRASLQRNFSTLRAIVNFTTREYGISDVTAFSGVYLGEDLAEKTTKRASMPPDVIRQIQGLCRSIDDEARWLIALISDTGMRLSEAVGVVVDDVHLDGRMPHINLKAHPWRRLKTDGSERLVPLVGASAWAAQRALNNANGRFLFSKYCSPQGCNANSASAALNKWLSPRVPNGCVVHSFRHSMRDRLRAVECPADIVDQIGGWVRSGVGEAYGTGYPLKVLYKWMEKTRLTDV